MAAADCFEHRILGDDGAHIAALCSQMREVRNQVCFGNGGGAAANAAGGLKRGLTQLDKDALLNLDAAVMGSEYLALVFFSSGVVNRSAFTSVCLRS